MDLGFFNDILNPGGGFDFSSTFNTDPFSFSSTDPTSFINPTQGADYLSQYLNSNGLGTTTDFLGNPMSGMTTNLANSGGSFIQDPSSTFDYFSQLSKVNNLLPKGLGGSGNANPSLLQSLFGSGGLLGSGGIGGLLSSAASVAPSLAAINYARNLGEPDTSQLQSALNSINPNSLALPYDLATGTGRNTLTSSLTNRGVAGSSFGDQSLESYNTLRDLGRQNLLTGGATAQAGIANQILQAQTAQQKNKLDLYGRSLLALSGGLSPKSGGLFGA